jgi:hypothetical protein
MEHRKLKQREGGAKAPLFYCFVGGLAPCIKKRPLRALVIDADPRSVSWYGLHAYFPVIIVIIIAQGRSLFVSIGRVRC